MSPDGLHLYVPGRDSDSLVMFDRNPTTGVLTERACFRFTAATGCTTTNASPLEVATGAAVSPDGKSLYVVGGAAGGGRRRHRPLHARRQRRPDLRQLPRTGGTCTQAPALGNAAAVAVSPDGTRSTSPPSTRTRSRCSSANPSTGALNQGFADERAEVLPARQFRGLHPVGLFLNPRDIEVTPDGKQVLILNNGYNNGFTDNGLNIPLATLDRASNGSVRPAGRRGLSIPVEQRRRPVQGPRAVRVADPDGRVRPTGGAST